jgi:retron-type reverse transcriptase
VPVKTNKSEDSNLASNLTFNKTCEVSLEIILFIEKMNKIEDTRSVLDKMAFSNDSLLVAYDLIKSKPGNLTPGQGKETLKGINLRWFKTTTSKLLKGLFTYPKTCRVEIPKKLGSNETRPLTLTSPRIKIIERSILNAIEPVFKGKFKMEKLMF